MTHLIAFVRTCCHSVSTLTTLKTSQPTNPEKQTVMDRFTDNVDDRGGFAPYKKRKAWDYI